MLILKRKRRQRLLIGDAIVTILSWSRNSVRVGVEAPASLLVLRDELVDQAAAVDVDQAGQARTGGSARTR